jgi:putative OPT family oligopeptide transporter
MTAQSPPDASPLRAEPADATPAHRPFVPDSQNLHELTFSAVALGTVLGIIFGASSLYLFLKVGMTVSASIPVAVLAITIFRAFSKALGTRRATILENNIVQTAGSAGESIAFGVGATMPALMLLGYEMDPLRVMLVSLLGGVLGILMMIPLRRAFIVKQHGTLTYPEGTACAKILIAGEEGGASAKTVFTGFGLAFAYQVLMEAMRLWSKEPAHVIGGIKGYTKAVVACEVSPALLGVGYIIGTRTASLMVGGGILAALVLTPAIAFFGEGLDKPLYPGTHLVREMAASEITRSYVRYIGAGAVATAGIISLCKALPLIIASITGGLRDLRSGQGPGSTARTQRDLPFSFVGIGALALVATIASTNLIPINLLGRLTGAILILLFGFLFVTVSSRLTGEIGSSSNPISGMTIATLLMTCLIFVLLGWVGPEYRVSALSIAAIVCIASSNGGTTSQDLKTGFLVGATPSYQQVAIIVGALTSALVIGFTLLWLNNVYTDVTSDPAFLPKIAAPVAELTATETRDGQTYKVWWVTKTVQGVEQGRYLVDPQTGQARFRIDPGIGGVVTKRADKSVATKFRPPQPELFAVIIDGIMKGDLPWVLVVLGAGLAIVMQLAGVSALAFAVGVYLPLSTTLPIFCGGLVRAVVDRYRKMTAEESDRSPAVLMASGLIAGASLAGVLLTIREVDFTVGGYPVARKIKEGLDLTSYLPAGWAEAAVPAIIAFALVVLALLWVGLAAKPPGAGEPPTGETTESEQQFKA